jgi:hypothetical protein
MCGMKTRALPPRAGFSLEPLEPRIAPAVVHLANLTGVDGFKLSGVADHDNTGQSVQGAGDVNGDGYADFIIGAPQAAEGGNARGAAYVVFGKASGFPANIDLSTLDGTNGFKLSGVADQDLTGSAVSGAGDVNGDGFADVIVGAGFSNQGGSQRGAAYVVFGKASGFAASMSLSDLNGTNGFKISGLADGDQLGGAVNTAGDVNGDGFADVIVGAKYAAEGGTFRGAAYVIFGKANGFGATVSLSGLDGTSGFKMSGLATGDHLGESVSSAGDVNHDGFSDIILGSWGRSEGGNNNRGAAYVIFGKASGFGATVSLSGLDGTTGFKLLGIDDFDLAGSSVSAAGDINGDGFGDVIVGSYSAHEGGTNRGAAYVFFGKASGFDASLSLSALNGSNGFKISGAADNDFTGISVSGAGDFNGDGIADLIIGAIGPEAGSRNGAAYVIFGKASGFSASIPLATLDAATGFKIAGEAFNDIAGDSVSAAGDVNKDGFADVIIGAPQEDNFGGNDRGAAYVVFGNAGHPAPVISSDHKTATYTDVDGDLVTVKTTKGAFSEDNFTLVKQGSGAYLQRLDVAFSQFNGAGITITAKTPKGGIGDGLVNVGMLDATLTTLGKVSINGDLQQIDAESAASLTVYSMGQYIDGAPVESEISGKLGALTVKTDMSHVTIAAETFGAIKALNVDHVTLLAEGVSSPTSVAQALAIKSLTIGGTVHDSHVLAGYDNHGDAVNADVTVGAVKVAGQWIASDLVAGAEAGMDGIFGTADDALIAGGNTIVSKIASIKIAGAAIGTMSDTMDGFGFVAEQIGSFGMGKSKLPLHAGAHNDMSPLLIGVTGDVRVRELS